MPRREVTEAQWLEEIRTRPDEVARLLAFQTRLGEMHVDEAGRVWEGGIGTGHATRYKIGDRQEADKVTTGPPPDLGALLARMAEQSKSRLWDEWAAAQPDKRLPFDIEQGWDAGWDSATTSFLVFIEQLITNGLLVQKESN